MTLKTKCIYSEREESDGIRISVMSRHTLSDGKTPDPHITKESYDIWRPLLAAPPRLIGDYYKRGLSWEDFELKYRTYLLKPEIRRDVETLAKQAELQDITILCVEETPEKCHRRLLAEECKRILPGLEIIVL